jgi:hypothetical protein
MTVLERTRGRTPLVVFILLAVLVIAMVGFACACLGGTPFQPADRASAGGAALPALIEMWALLAIVLAPVVAWVARRDLPRGRASPAQLQRFLF